MEGGAGIEIEDRVDGERVRRRCDHSIPEAFAYLRKFRIYLIQYFVLGLIYIRNALSFILMLYCNGKI